ncbi:response regulator transcription factor [Modestobacter sp. I12A-02662]|uniref:helix-turn-helix transcriptional regulator n=1 Tax=Modestobacter sp. I12A-02662 TaxID=1730496 RepID=UPI0034DF7887
MADRIPTYVYAGDPISQAGVVSQLRPRSEVRIVEETDLDRARVAVIVADVVDAESRRVLRAVQRGGVPRTVLVAGTLDDAAVAAAARAGVSGLLRRTEATAEALVRVVVRAAAGRGEVPGGLPAAPADRVHRRVLPPPGLALRGLSDRETQVLRLVADGHDTAEIAAVLCYSERTVKNVLHAVTSRLQLRNRSHAVAYALREGLI